MESLKLAGLMLDNLPFEPNDQQLQLLAALARFCAPAVKDEPSSAEQPAVATTSDRVFLLNGYAGTGKTSLIGAVVRTLGAVGVKTVLLAPTGRAAKVLAAACNHPAYTIHRRIYRSDSTGAISLEVAENTMTDTVFIVDEASMIGDDSAEGINLLRDLIYFVYSGVNCRLILLGDSAQLPPVGCEVSPAMNPEVLRSYGLKTTRAVITATARQKHTSGILYNATRLRSAMRLPEPLPAPVVYQSMFDDVRVVEGEQLADAVSADYADGPDGLDNTIIITRSNRRAVECNLGVRTGILDYEGELTVGERLMVVKNNYLWGARKRGFDFLANGDIGIVERIIATEERYGLRFADVMLRFADRPEAIECKIMLDTLYSDAPSLSSEKSMIFEQSIFNDPDLFTPSMSVAQRRRLLRQNPYYQALRVKYGYCVTCHKAQGGQWRNVYVDTGYVPPEASGLELYRWLYTAVTRATTRLNFINPPFEVK